MKSARALVGHFTGSSQASAWLLASQSSTSSPVGVIQDIVTRWWSTYSMCKRLLRLKNYFAVLVTEQKLALTLTDSEWVTLQDMSDILEPFMFAQSTLEGQKYVTISIIPYIIFKCRQGLIGVKNAAGTKSSIRTLASRMLHSFNSEWGSGEENTVYNEHKVEGNRRRLKGLRPKVMLAAALDPRTKALMSIPSNGQALI